MEGARIPCGWHGAAGCDENALGTAHATPEREALAGRGLAFNDVVELVEGGDGFGIFLNVFEQGAQSDVDGLFGLEFEFFEFEAGVVHAGPSVSEAGEVGGIVVAFADEVDGVHEQGADEEAAAGGRIFAGFLAGGGGELFHAVDEAGDFFAVSLFAEPGMVMVVVEFGESAAEVELGGGEVAGATGPDEGIRVAGLES